jgi:antitoxin (DNA-binding transcriptional repressor) of toxin-antitoxin stability system
MRKASIRDLRYHFPEIEARLREGEEIEITKHKRVIVRLSPVKRRRARRRPPDFMAMLKEIYGEKILPTTGAEIVAEQRGDR